MSSKPCSYRCLSPSNAQQAGASSKNLSLTLALWGALAWTASASAQGLELQGAHHDEVSTIRQLGQGRIERVSPTRLRISLPRKALVFDDRPPYDEPLAGTRYRFLDRRGGFILLGLEEDEHSHGLLIDEETAAVTPGGERVLFAPDGRAYFAVEQHNGMDAEVWKVYHRDGREAWAGASYVPDPQEPLRARYYLDGVSWSAKGELQARAACAQQPLERWSVKLIRNAQAEWTWRPLRPCGTKR
ncbi:hypothetical protein [Inhella proteolytica]|uniref:Uncharacterized protein n=1 Tax=Inhella proteolytica TaxID=2795029 RepID=A0A931NGQ6_9BURK|nr:hypothetical protein [Inhella proteolytica]MBH9576963.1 hypothetical protein [Inhella proteolytica]